MNHSFIPSVTSLFICVKCGFDRTSHSDKAICESCSYIGSCEAVSIRGSNALLCPSCSSKVNIDSTSANEELYLDKSSSYASSSYASEVPISANPIPSNSEVINLEDYEVIQKDYTLRYRQDLYNAKTQSIESLRELYPDEKDFLSKLTEHYNMLTRAIHESRVEQLVIAQKIHDLGAEARKEFRAKKQSEDESYKPAKPVKERGRLKVPGREKLSPMERIVQTYALDKGITMDEARAKIYSNPALMNLLDDKES